MTALYLFTRGGLPLHDLERVQQGQQPLAALDMRLGRMEVRERRVAYQRSRDLGQAVEPVGQLVQAPAPGERGRLCPRGVLVIEGRERGRGV